MQDYDDMLRILAMFIAMYIDIYINTKITNIAIYNIINVKRGIVPE